MLITLNPKFLPKKTETKQAISTAPVSINAVKLIDPSKPLKKRAKKI
jgi:hypothetical protein